MITLFIALYSFLAGYVSSVVWRRLTFLDFKLQERIFLCLAWAVAVPVSLFFLSVMEDEK